MSLFMTLMSYCCEEDTHVWKRGAWWRVAPIRLRQVRARGQYWAFALEGLNDFFAAQLYAQMGQVENSRADR
jgi:hypothetical protein